MTTIRAATAADLPSVAAVYDDQVRTSIATFDVEPPHADEWRRRLDATGPGLHLLVADRGGEVVGYATSSSYRPRAGYRLTRETSVYLVDGARGEGIGRLLYDTLLARVADDGIHVVLGLVALPNPASVALHEACGFEHVGTLREVGRKFDRWLDTAWFQKIL